MKKVELLSSIQELSSLLASEKAISYMTEGSVEEMQKALDRMTEEYLEVYCAA